MATKNTRSKRVGFWQKSSMSKPAPSNAGYSIPRNVRTMRMIPAAPSSNIVKTPRPKRKGTYTTPTRGAF